MPVNLIYGHVDQININFALRSLNSEAVKIRVDTVNIVLSPQEKKDWEELETVFTDYDKKSAWAEKFV